MPCTIALVYCLVNCNCCVFSCIMNIIFKYIFSYNDAFPKWRESVSGTIIKQEGRQFAYTATDAQ